LPTSGGHDGHDHGEDSSNSGAFLNGANSQSSDDHDGHDHGGAFEWAGIFETPGDWYTWTAQKTKGSNGLRYLDPNMKLAAIPVSKADDATLHKVKAEGDHAMEMKCTDLQAGDTITPMEDKCYKLIFSEHSWQSLYQVKASGTAAVAFFAQHFPTEFENDAHYLKDPSGEDIEPAAELPEAAPAPAPAVEEEDVPWGPVMLASIIVNLITLVGVVMAIPAINKAVHDNVEQVFGIICGFAAGAILSCAFFLLLFEATHLIAAGWQKEVDILWRWGTMILAGLLLPGIIDCIAHATTSSQDAEKDMKDASVSPKVDAKEELKKEGEATRSEKWRIFLGVNLGDFFHNLCDGFFVAAAFKGCGTKFGWTVATGTILHELAQELADYLILTGPRLAMSPVKALVCNFLAGLGVVVGAIIVLSLDIGNDAIGLLLAFGGGVYLHIGAVECMPRMYAKGLTPKSRIASVVAFIVGAIAIGLVLLDHEHCVPPPPPGAEPAADPHAGHHH